jgi:hypothetical protein
MQVRRNQVKPIGSAISAVIFFVFGITSVIAALVIPNSFTCGGQTMNLGDTCYTYTYGGMQTSGNYLVIEIIGAIFFLGLGIFHLVRLYEARIALKNEVAL